MESVGLSQFHMNLKNGIMEAVEENASEAVTLSHSREDLLNH